MGKKNKALKKWQKIAIPVAGVALLAGGAVALIVLNNNQNKDDHSLSTGVADVQNIAEGELFELTDGENLILKAGSYRLTGSCNGFVHVNASDEENVYVELDNVSISNDSGAAIYVESNGNTYMTLSGENKLISSPTEDINGVIYAQSDLQLLGDGTLSIESSLDGIVGKDDVEIKSGKYTISATDDGIVGKDSLKIESGDYEITSGGLGLKTSNEEEKGDLDISGGNFKVESELKAIKSEGSLAISGGTFDIVSGDDGVHSNGFIYVTGGDITVEAGDDGFHANEKLTVDDGKIVVKKSGEAFEGNIITINGGSLDLSGDDDGINATNSDGSNEMFTSGDAELRINGGEVYVESVGDGLDSNGKIYISGGMVRVDGPENDGNAAVDCDGGIEITGGDIIALGMSGMAQNATSSSQPSVLVNLSSKYSSGSAIEFGDAKYTSKKSFNSILISNSSLSVGSSYDLKIDGSVAESISITTNIVGSGMGGGMMPGGGGVPGGGAQQNNRNMRRR